MFECFGNSHVSLMFPHPSSVERSACRQSGSRYPALREINAVRCFSRVFALGRCCRFFEYYRAAWTARDRDVFTIELTLLDSMPGRNQKCLPTMDNDLPASYNGIRRWYVPDWLKKQSTNRFSCFNGIGFALHAARLLVFRLRYKLFSVVLKCLFAFMVSAEPESRHVFPLCVRKGGRRGGMMPSSGVCFGPVRWKGSASSRCRPRICFSCPCRRVAACGSPCIQDIEFPAVLLPAVWREYIS